MCGENAKKTLNVNQILYIVVSCRDTYIFTSPLKSMTSFQLACTTVKYNQTLVFDYSFDRCLLLVQIFQGNSK